MNVYGKCWIPIRIQNCVRIITILTLIEPLYQILIDILYRMVEEGC